MIESEKFLLNHRDKYGTMTVGYVVQRYKNKQTKPIQAFQLIVKGVATELNVCEYKIFNM